MVPSIEMVRLVNSGTEAAMSAIRLARGYTGRDRIIKFSGCYHGHSDSLLARAGSGAATFAIPDSLGVPGNVVDQTVVVPFNDLEAVRRHIEENPNRLAAVVVEPVAGNMGVVPPQGRIPARPQRPMQPRWSAPDFRRGHHRLQGGAWRSSEAVRNQARSDLPGKDHRRWLAGSSVRRAKAIMEYLAPVGGVYQAGTLSGNPLAVAAGFGHSQDPQTR